MSFPDMADVLDDWTEPVTLSVVKTTVEDFEAVRTKRKVAPFDAVMQPMPARKVSVKAEGERAWTWWEAWSSTRLQIGTVVRDAAGKLFKVMSAEDWSQADFYRYEFTETFEGAK